MWHPTYLGKLVNLFTSPAKGTDRKRSLRFWMNYRLRKGYLAERKACRYLQARGLTILERNYRTRSGELDIIAQERNTLVFVEVKCRTTDQLGSPEEAVHFRKRARIKASAREYLLRQQVHNHFRFDIIAILTPSPWRRATIKWIRNAFGGISER